jgi:uncharacterized protein
MTPPLMHGRAEEIQQLNEAASRAAAGNPQFVVLYGRRRTGKTFLLRRFLEQYDPDVGAYHACSYLSPTEELGTLLASPALAERVTIDLDASLDDQLNAIATAAQDQLLIVVLDEIPYLIEGSDRFPAALQKLWDRITDTSSRLMLVLTGSSIATMTKVVSSGGPLFMRPTKLMQLHPFNFATSASFLGVTSDSPRNEQRAVVEARAACGGYPLLLSRWDISKTGIHNVRALASNPLDPLVAMSSVLLLDLPDARGIKSTLTAIGRGVHKHSEIQSRADQRIDSALSTLQLGGYVTAETPIGTKEEKARQRKIYRIADEHLLFYFAMIDPYRQLFEASQGASVLEGSTPRWNSLVEATFERDARSDAVGMVQKGIVPHDTLVGQWWTDRPIQAQIDVVGVNARSGAWVLAGEAKWVPRFGTHEMKRLERAISVAGPQANNCQKAIWVPQTDVVEESSRAGILIRSLSDFF